MTRTLSKYLGLNAKQRREYERLAKKLEGLPLLAQGSVFAIKPPEGLEHRAIEYKWTRKVNAKTVSRNLTREEYDALKRAIEANREVEAVLKRMRQIAQEAIAPPRPPRPKKQSP